MNRIISANINGFVFQIDELAYDRLKQYLESLRLRITEKEVYDDIENRIAELFSHLLNTGTPAIFLNHVEDVIAQVGSAEELGDAMDSVDRDGAAEGEAFASGAASGHAGVVMPSACIATKTMLWSTVFVAGLRRILDGIQSLCVRFLVFWRLPRLER